jgi:hypothetical protein
VPVLKRRRLHHLFGNIFGQFNKILYSFSSYNIFITPDRVFKRRQQSSRTMWRCSPSGPHSQQHQHASAWNNAAVQAHGNCGLPTHVANAHFLFFLGFTMLQGHRADENEMKNKRK